MITVRLKGGMGNQMFQYALARRLARERGTGVRFDVSQLLYRNKPPGFVYRDYDLDVFLPQADFLVSPDLLRPLYATRLRPLTRRVARWAARGLPEVREAHFHYDPKVVETAREDVIYNGWFQSPRYFAPAEAAVRADFRFARPLLPASRSVHDRLQATNSVCLNVRRTDFLKDATLNTTDQAYFLRGADYLAGQLPDAEFFVFSDDVAWCREHIRLDRPTTFVGHEHKGYKFGNYLRLMRDCRHFLIPNSSFAWWAAWLSTAAGPDKQVVAPQRWFADPAIDTSDLVPASWTRV